MRSLRPDWYLAKAPACLSTVDAGRRRGCTWSRCKVASVSIRPRAWVSSNENLPVAALRRFYQITPSSSFWCLLICRTFPEINLSHRHLRDQREDVGPELRR